MPEVMIVGAGLTKVDEHWDRNLESLLAESALKALDDAKISKVDSIYVANLVGEVLQEQAHLGCLVAEELGMSGVPAVRIEAAAASGVAAVRAAMMDIASGNSEIVLVAGGDKLSDGSTSEATSCMMMAERQEYAGFVGATPTGLSALLYQIYLKRYAAKQDDIALFPVICHENAVTSPHAQYQYKISLESVLTSPYVSEPLHRLECAGIGDGAASLILCTKEAARRLDGSKAELSACTLATDIMTAYDREDPLALNSLQRASNSAYEISGITRDEVDTVELHDAFSILAPLSLEAAGFVSKGRGAAMIKNQEVSLSGKLPANTFGGLKARGYPAGATGVYQVCELFLQVTGRAGKNQVDGAKVGVAQSVGGLAGSSGVAVVRAA